MLVKVDQIIRNITMGENYPWDKYNLYLAYAFRGIRHLQMNAASVKTTYLTLDSAKVAPLPNDFMKLSKIGIVRDGRVHTLTVDTRIVSQRQTLWTCEDGSVSTTPPPGGGNSIHTFSPVGLTFPNFIGDSFAFYGYGAGENPDGVYRIDEQNRQIQFSSGVSAGSEGLVMEYITNGIEADPDGHTYIDERAWEALTAFIKWKVEEDKPPQKARLADRDYWKREYYKRKDEYAINKFSFTFEDLTWFADAAYSQSPIRPRR